MIKRPTWILLILLILAIGSYFFFKSHPSASSVATPTALGDKFIFTTADGTLQTLLISDNQGNTFQMLRDPSGTWVITKPTTGVADQSLASAADTQVGALRILTTLDTQPDPTTIQLSNPAHTMEMGFSTKAQHQLEIGALTPTSSGYYVRVDGGTIYVISKAGIDALLNLLTAPPFPATATPTPVTATPTPVTATPISVTATPPPAADTETPTPTP
jgi:hypothetical protein